MLPPPSWASQVARAHHREHPKISFSILYLCRPSCGRQYEQIWIDRLQFL